MDKLIIRKIITALNLFFGILLIPWFIGLPFTMLLVGPIEKYSLSYFIATDYLLYPVFLIISVILSRKYRLVWWSILPVVNIILFLAAIFLF
jgi:hypothetical protein